MKEGRFRPSLQPPPARLRGSSGCLNEGGSVPTLVAASHMLTQGVSRSLNEGGSVPTLVGPPGARSNLQVTASMKEGRFRPSLPQSCDEAPFARHASMKEGRFRPSLLRDPWGKGTRLKASMKEGRFRPSLASSEAPGMPYRQPQ